MHSAGASLCSRVKVRDREVSFTVGSHIQYRSALLSRIPFILLTKNPILASEHTNLC